MPFDPYDRLCLQEHFERHGHEFGVNSPEEYEALADAFWQRVAFPPLYECTRPNGARCRYDEETEEYSVLASWGTLITYFRPVPCADFEEADDACPDDCHGYPSNMHYFGACCR